MIFLLLFLTNLTNLKKNLKKPIKSINPIDN